MVLGIGGVRALRALGHNPDVYHFNEGHALFAGFELIREKMGKSECHSEKPGKRPGNRLCLPLYPCNTGQWIPPSGKIHVYKGKPEHEEKTVKAVRWKSFQYDCVGTLEAFENFKCCCRPHRVTANKMWKKVRGKSKIISITNGIPILHGLTKKRCWIWQLTMTEATKPKTRSSGKTFGEQEGTDRFYLQQDRCKTWPRCTSDWFSRRAAPYKRSNLIFQDRAFIEPLLKKGKLQIVFSGKSHPLDDGGKDSFRYCWNDKALSWQCSVFGRLWYGDWKDADQGSDIWLNNPRRQRKLRVLQVWRRPWTVH